MPQPLIIAEIGQAHEGSLGMAHSYIDALSGTGVDAVKFQVHIAEAESSSMESFRIPFSYEDQSRYDYWRRMEFTQEQWGNLKAHCEDKEMELIASPFSCAAVDLLEKIGLKRYKIASGEVRNKLMLKKIADTGKPVILSSGMSNFEELDELIAFFKRVKSELSILQCTTAYPCPPRDWGLNVIAELAQRYNVPTGYSDHSGDIFACLAATALGASILEFHVVYDKRQFGPDSSTSISVNEVSRLVEGVRQISTALDHPVDKTDNSRFELLRKLFGKSLAVNRDLKAGHRITEGDLESKKPEGEGVAAEKYDKVIGKKLIADLRRFDFLKDENLES